MGWPRWRGAAVQAADAPAFDALVDLGLGCLPPGIGRDAAVAAAIKAVAALPGASWISVELHRQTTPAAAQVFPAGTSDKPDGDAWQSLRLRVEATALQAVAGLAPAAVDPPIPARREATFEETLAQRRTLDYGSALIQHSSRGGFAESMAAAPFDALDKLAALARLVSQTSAIQSSVGQPSRAAPTLIVPESPEMDPGVLIVAQLLGFVLPTDGRGTAIAAMQRFGSFAAILAAPENELRRVPGLGTHGIAAIKLIHAAAIRLARAGVTGQPLLENSERLVAYLSAVLARERIEQFRILFLDDRGMLRADEVQGTGTVNHTPVYPREVVRRALELGASALVLVHNHPSGDPTPSEDDIDMTRQISEAAAALSIVIRDHYIIGNGRWFSFREGGLL
jgi:DNA repair protein RadC